MFGEDIDSVWLGRKGERLTQENLAVSQVKSDEDLIRAMPENEQEGIDTPDALNLK